MGEKRSKRFTSTQWTERLVPALLVALIVGLLALVVGVILSGLGWLPGM